jgi:predicted permease
MVSVLVVVLPIFALILAGWLARRLGVLGPHASGELNRFVVWLALPALLFDIVANATWSEIWRPGFVGAFGLGAATVFIATLAWRLRASRSLADASIAGLNAAYANTAFLGFPLALGALGPASLTPTLIASILTVCVIFAAALVLVEVGQQTERRPGRMALKVAASLVRNPLVVAPVLGGVFLAFGIRPPGPMETFLKLLGAAASPCALVAMGLFLAQTREGPKPALGTTGVLVALKLLAQPLVTWVFAAQVFHLDPVLTHAAVLLAALPTGTGPFMVAEFYKLDAGLTARVILVSTILSLVTVTAYLSLIRG